MLLQCAELAQATAGLPLPNNIDLFSARMSAALAYRKRASELVKQADRGTTSRPDEMEGVALFLLTTEDDAFRDSARAVKLAEAAVEAVPMRGSAWFTLALAQYRSGALNAAEHALAEAEKRPLGGRSTLREAALLSLIRARQGDLEDARALYNKAHAVVRSGHTADPLLKNLTAEAAEFLRSTQPDDE
jgi:tetratricopeptide (TPR) repeat protein